MKERKLMEKRGRRGGNFWGWVVEGALEEGGFGDGELVGWVVSHTGVWRRLLRGLRADGVARGGFFSFLLFFSPCEAEN